MADKFSILIPTRNRAETLFWCIKSCLEQKCDNLEVIVSDNCSSDDTKTVVASFSDARLRYYNTGNDLSMSDNWEFAISKVREGYVTILGDDDAFIPGAVREIERLLSIYMVKAITWKQSFYRWPSNRFARIANLLAISKGGPVEVRKGKVALRKLLDYEMFVEEVPWIYGGFVHIDLVTEVKKKGNGLFFNSRIPDIYSAVVLSSVTNDYLYSNTPFSIAGHSGKSNGSAQMMPTVNIVATETFKREAASIPFHPDLEFIHTHAFLLWESYLQARHAGILDESCFFDKWKIFQIGLKECSNLGTISAEGEKLMAVAARNNFDLSLVKRRYRSLSRRRGKMLSKLITRAQFWATHIIVDGEKKGFSNVFDASMEHLMVSKALRPLYIFSNLQTLCRRVFIARK